MNSYSSLEILPYQEQIVNDDLESVLSKAERLQNSSALVRQYLVRHLISEKKADQAHYTATCGSYLVFKQYKNADRTLKLERANFCKHPMCPVCAWRRHLKYSKIIDKALEIGKYRYLYHIVLGVPNSDVLTRESLMRLKERGASFVKQKFSAGGYVSNLEVVNHGNGMHPHLHILAEAPEFIRNSADYVKEMSAKWLNHYTKGLENKTALRERYAGFTFFITGITKEERKNASLELTKYIVKGDFTSDDGESVSKIARAIKGVRKMSSAGVFKSAISEAKKEIAIDTAEFIESLSREEYELLIYKFINGEYRKEPLV